ncbi:MAG TPA: 4Fe-4S dicluster domain-containing protein [bacterium]|nr:4Fe-4S dicluster domain-containing protein [bacterium]
MKKLLIDFDICDGCEGRDECPAKCSYPYHPGNAGVTSLRELAAYAVICRRCELANCISACPKEALEKNDKGILVRHNMRCISCKSCSLACPFGTIYPDAIPYGLSRCDYCLGRIGPNEDPLCVRTCPLGAIRYVEIAPDEAKQLREASDNLIVKCSVWKR